MYRYNSYVGGVVALLAWSCAAQASGPVYATANGGFWCRDPSEISATLAGKFKDARDGIGPSCGKIAPHERISPTRLREIGGGMRAGKGDTEDAYDAEFVLYGGAFREFKRVAADDIRVTPSRWIGQHIEINGAHVYWVSPKDVRVVSPGSDVVVMAKGVKLSDDFSYYAEECETVAASATPKCRASVRFSYSEFEIDNPTGTRNRLVLVAPEIDLIKPSRRR